MTLLATSQLITNALHLDAPTLQLEGEIDWEQLVHHADGHSLTPLLYATWRDTGQLDRLPHAIRDRMAQAYADNALRNLNIRQELVELDQILTEAGVPHLVLKGWSLIENFYPDPAQRVLYDHDFLVPADRAELGHRALRAAGFRPLPGKDEWIEKHLPSLWRNDGYRWNGYLFDPFYPCPVELHVRLWEQGWRGLKVRQLPHPWADAPTRIIAGAPMQHLSAENTLIHLAMHFAGHLVEREARLNQLLDLARFAQMSASLDWDHVLRSANQAQVGRFVALYERIWQVLGARVVKPDLVVYLQARPDVLAARIRKRARDFERQLAPDYLEAVSRAYGEFFFHYEETPLLVVNTSDLDLGDEGDLDALMKEIRRHRRGRLHFSLAGHGG
jgi:hypothetical protein